MATSLAITVSPETVSLTRRAKGIAPKEVTFAVTNTSTRTVTARADLDPRGAVSHAWLELHGERERDLEPDATRTFTVRIAPPANAPAGRHTFRLNMVDVHRPDEGVATGPEVAFDVPEPLEEDAGPSFPRWLILAIAATVVIGGLAALLIVIDPFGWFGEEEVPGMIGMTVAEATDAAEQAGFTLEVAEEPVASDDVDAGTVAEQAPGAGETAERESEIVVTLAAVPDVAGMARDDAFEALRAAGLEPSVGELTRARGSAVGTVLSQDPGPSEIVEPGGGVTLVVGGAQVPPLEDLNVSDALRRLAGTGLPFELRPVFTSGRSAGTVVSQSVEAGEVVEAGTTVRLGVASRLDLDLDELIDPALRQRFDLPLDFGNGPVIPVPPIGP